MKHISSDEAIQLKDKLDSLQRRYNELTARGADMLKHAQEALPLVQQFHNSHHRLVDWMLGAEATLQAAEPREEDISRLEADIQEFRPVLENINLIGPQLCQISPGEGASTIEGLVTRDNRRFDAIVEQIQRKAERIHLSKQRSLEVISDIDELLDWFREVESNLREAEPPSSEPDVIRVQLKEHKALNDDISSQKTRVRDVLSTAKKVLRESPQHEDTSIIREKMEDLRESMDTVSGLSSDRLGILEQALPLAEHFHETHGGLSSWMTDMERQVSHLALPALRPDLIAQQQDKNEVRKHPMMVPSGLWRGGKFYFFPPVPRLKPIPYCLIKKRGEIKCYLIVNYIEKCKPCGDVNSKLLIFWGSNNVHFPFYLFSNCSRVLPNTSRWLTNSTRLEKL